MSDSELSDVSATKVPSDTALERVLRKETTKQFENNLTVLTVNSVRKSAEEALHLDVDFFVHDEAWKARSKTIIKEQMELLADAADGKEVKSSPRTVSTNAKHVNPTVARLTPKTAPKKRPSPAAETHPKKRQKHSSSNGDKKNIPASNTTEESDPEPKRKDEKTKLRLQIKHDAPAKTSKKAPANGKPKPERKKQISKTEQPDTSADDSEEEPTPRHLDDNSGSELSVLMGEEPQPKKKKKKKRKSKDSSAEPKQAAKAKPSTDNDPEQEEIKRLQGWLVKCGIRKIWAFELKPYETSKAKIKHLKEMLSEVGMAGRYSMEKASQIKEARELAADIEAVQEGNEIWGKDGEDRSRRSKRSDNVEADDHEDDDGDSAPKKKLIRGPKRYDFLSSDGEETD